VDLEVYNNIIERCSTSISALSYGITDGPYSCSSCKIYNNTILNCYGGLRSYGQNITNEGATGTIIKNNLVYGSTYRDFYEGTSADAIIENNFTGDK
jgi:hypothetical protein